MYNLFGIIPNRYDIIANTYEIKTTMSNGNPKYNPPADVDSIGKATTVLASLHFNLLHRRELILKEITQIEERTSHNNGQRPPVHRFQSLLKVFVLDLEPMLMRWMSEGDKYEKLRRSVDSKDYEHNLKAFRYIQRLLDDRNIIKIDINKAYDSTDIEVENELSGM